MIFPVTNLSSPRFFLTSLNFRVPSRRLLSTDVEVPRTDGSSIGQDPLSFRSFPSHSSFSREKVPAKWSGGVRNVNGLPVLRPTLMPKVHRRFSLATSVAPRLRLWYTASAVFPVCYETCCSHEFNPFMLPTWTHIHTMWCTFSSFMTCKCTCRHESR